jgi:tetratricopeptide (TPR) repeat protein
VKRHQFIRGIVPAVLLATAIIAARTESAAQAPQSEATARGEAAAHADTAAPQPPLTAIARHYALAEQAFRAGDFTQAEKVYSKILEFHGDEPFAWFRIGLMQQRRQSFRAALNAYDSALACATGEPSDEIRQVLAKVRFNRAVLLLESAAKDLKAIAPGALEQNLDLTREALTTHVDAALRVADSEVSVDPPVSAAAGKPSATGYASAKGDASAKGYVYEVKRAVVSVGPIEEQHP